MEHYRHIGVPLISAELRAAPQPDDIGDTRRKTGIFKTIASKYVGKQEVSQIVIIRNYNFIHVTVHRCRFRTFILVRAPPPITERGWFLRWRRCLSVWSETFLFFYRKNCHFLAYFVDYSRLLINVIITGIQTRSVLFVRTKRSRSGLRFWSPNRWAFLEVDGG